MRRMKAVKALIAGTGAINWFPGHMAAATKAIRNRLRVADLVVELRDSRIPISSANGDLQPILSAKRRIIALSKKDLSEPTLVTKWIEYFNSLGQDCAAVNSHSRGSVQQLLEVVEVKLRELVKREPTLIVMVVGVPNVGKSALINSIHQIARSRFPVQGRTKRATVGPLPGVTQDIAGFKIAHRPSIYVLDTPGVLVPSISDIETGLKLALAGSVKDSVVGEDRIAEYLLAVLNSRGTPLQWKDCHDRIAKGIQCNPPETVKHSLKDLVPKKKKKIDTSSVVYVKDLMAEVQNSLYVTLSEFSGNVEDENDLGDLIELQFEALQKVLKIPHKAEEARLMVSKKFLTLFRAGKLGSIILDDVPETSSA